MGTETLDDYVALNEQLAALVAAGVPIDAGLENANRSAAATLERIQRSVTRRVGRGETLDEALAGDDEVPGGYRSLVRIGLHSQTNLAAGFDGASQVAGATDRIRYALDSALVYPLVVSVLAYAGTICLCVFFVPALENMYQGLRLPPGAGLRVLQVLRDAMPYWAVALPVLLVVLLAWRLRVVRQRAATSNVTGLAGWLPGFSKVIYQLQCARLADSLAELLRQGVSLSEALQVVADSTSDARLHDAVGRLALASQEDRLPADDSPTAVRFPPFLRWAIWHSEETMGRARALEIAARVYRETIVRRGQRLRTLAPMVAMVLLGGTITLLYCLALFVPLVELLKTLSQ